MTLVGIGLDFLNAFYDYARRACRRTFEMVARRILETGQNIYKATSYQSFVAETIRRTPETVIPLPPDACLSSFYDYEIVNGTPVFTLKDSAGISSLSERFVLEKQVPAWDSFTDTARCEKQLSDNQCSSSYPGDASLSFGVTEKQSKMRITCHAFSHDDRFFVCGKNDGTISVWNASNGKLEHELTEPHEFPIGDVAFRKESPVVLVSIDLHGWCVFWSLDSNPVTYSRTRCVPVWEDALYVGSEFALPCLSHDGQFLGFPVHTYVEPGIREASVHQIAASSSSSLDDDKSLLTKFFVVGYVFDLRTAPTSVDENSKPMLVLPVKVEERLNFEDCMLDLISFSNTGRCLSLTIYERTNAYLVVWPNAQTQIVESYKLQGTRCSFSHDDRFLVTWYYMSASCEQFSDCHCYIWELSNLQKVSGQQKGSGWHHPYYEATNPLLLRDPDQGRVHTCDFVRLGDELGLASCSVSDTSRITIWALKSADPIHVLRTDFTCENICSSKLRSLDRDIQQLDHVRGMKSVAISNDGFWVGMYSPLQRQGIIWNVVLGTEVLRIDLPPDKADPRTGMDFFFSETSTKMMMIGRTKVLLWDPSVLRAYNPKEKPLYVLDPSDEEMGMGETLCRFCYDSSTIGLMRVQSFCMDIWRFHPQQQYTLDRRMVTSEISSERNKRSNQNPFQLASVKYRFCQFAISPFGCQMVTCMGDMSVLLWNIQDRTQCRRIATLSSSYRPALDVCFSKNVVGSPTVVICQDQGLFVWISLLTDEIVHIEESGGFLRCQFNAEGTIGVIMSNLYHLTVWDLVERTKIKEINYSIPLMNTVVGDFTPESALDRPSFSPKLCVGGECCLLGFDISKKPIMANPTTLPSSLSTIMQNPRDVILSETGQWALMIGKVNLVTDDILLVHQELPELTNTVLEDGYPTIVYSDEHHQGNTLASTSNHHETNANGNHQTFKMIHLHGQYSSKQMRLPFKLKAHKFVVMSLDGRRFASLNMHNKLVVWSTHYTYKHVIQQRHNLMENGNTMSQSDVQNILNEYGASLVNHPYKKGWTVLMQCVVQKKLDMLQTLISWAKETRIYLSFHGYTSNLTDSNERLISTTNALDLAVKLRCPHIAEMLLQAMVQGATSETCLAKILEHSLIRLSYKYPTLVLKLFKTTEIMKPLCIVNISESYFKSGRGYLGVLTDKRLVASSTYIQELWTSSETKTAKALREKNNVEIQAEAKVIPYPNIAKIGPEGILQPLLLQRANHFVFSTALVRAVINYKYFAYARSLLLEDLYHYLFLLFTFTGISLYVGNKKFKDDRIYQIMPTILFAAFIGFGSIIRYLKQIYTLWTEQRFTGLFYYAKNFQKIIELISYFLVVFLIPVTVITSEEETVLSLIAIASILLWVKLLYYAQAFKPTGPMVIMMREIIKDIRWFLYLLVAFLVGFGVAFFVLLGKETIEDKEKSPDDDARKTGDGDGAANFESPWMSFLTMFLLMLSDVGDTLQSLQNFGLSPLKKTLTVLILVIFLGAVAIVLLNLLIAIMGDSFDRVKNHEKSLFLQKRAEIIQDMEMCLSNSRKQKFNENIECYLHVLNPQFRSNYKETDWEGRLVDIQRRMREELVGINEKESHDFLELKSEIKELKVLLKSLLDRTQSFSA